MLNTFREILEYIFPRALFGSSSPRLNTPTKVIWHHSNGVLFFPCAGTQHHTADIVESHHKTRWPGFTSRVYKNSRGEWSHTGYQFIINLKEETITMTRAFYEEGAHTVGMNRSSIGGLIIGNYDKCSGETIPKSKEWLIHKAWKMCKEEYSDLLISDNVPHRTYATKSCFGNSLASDYIQKVILRNMTTIDATANEKEERRITLTNKLIDLIQQYIALLTQRMSGKRLSLRE